ncbi:MAG: fructosamine kinase family protein [Polyangiaceae bacterium]|nr:fructosamine kinase family protein [Polyangiaceae bacterium]
MREALRSELGRALGSPVARASAISGGDINEAHAVELADGRCVFVKHNAACPIGMFEAEAEGLGWLGESHTLPVPGVLAVGADYLVLELIEPGRRGAGFDEELGRGLAALHASGAPAFGHARHNFIGRLPQDNSSEPDWPSFYRERRLRPMVDQARDVLGRELCSAFERLFANLADRVGPAEPPARLHGDLWGGNLHATASGAPCLIDPAVYAGHREMDLAMMKLFGGFGPRVFAAYDEAFPLEPGFAERVALYQLYPLLVHVNLFGRGYVGSVREALSGYL